MIKTLLFDLDGTLLDTAHDLASALNQLLESRDKPPLPFSIIRPLTGNTKALIKLGFGIDEQHDEFIFLWKELANIYSQQLAEKTKLFTGMEKVLDTLEKNNLPWGVVTNKLEWLTHDLLKQLNLFERCACVVSGDTVKNCKPHPEPLLHACKLLGAKPSESIYIGDAQTDVIAGRRAGMFTMLALYGYIGETENPFSWDADYVIEKPIEILERLNIKNSQIFYKRSAVRGHI
jgi:2-phosphoglycolate phosphatase